MDIQTILTTLGGLFSGGGLAWVMNWSAGKRQAAAMADKLIAEGYEARIASLHQVIENCNKTEIEHSSRIAQLNHSLDEKTELIRKLNDRVYDSEREVNRVQELVNGANERIIGLTEERDEERRLRELYGRWHCRRGSCALREPANPELAASGESFPGD